MSIQFKIKELCPACGCNVVDSDFDEDQGPFLTCRDCGHSWGVGTATEVRVSVLYRSALSIHHCEVLDVSLACCDGPIELDSLSPASRRADAKEAKLNRRLQPSPLSTFVAQEIRESGYLRFPQFEPDELLTAVALVVDRAIDAHCSKAPAHQASHLETLARLDRAATALKLAHVLIEAGFDNLRVDLDHLSRVVDEAIAAVDPEWAGIARTGA